MNAPPIVIQLSGVSKSYAEGDRTRQVLRRLDLRIPRGETVAMLGRSGSGKSTLLNLISGIDTPDCGEILVNGNPIFAMNDRDRTLFRRRDVGFVYQFFNLIPTLTVLENLLLPMELNGSSDPVRALGLLEEVELADRRDSFPDLLSGGEQQRVAIARALAHDPLILLADEPTGNLDEVTGDRVMNLLLGSAKERGKTLVMVTHSQEMARRADRILHLESGHVREERT